MIYLKAFVLALLEGVTEFVPVSSTGHMIILGDIIRFTGDKEAAFEIFIQLGAILAVVVIYFDKFARLLPSKSASVNRFFSGNGFSLLNIFVSVIPILTAGFFFHGLIKTYLFNPVTVACGLIVGGVLFIVVELASIKERVDRVEDINCLRALLIGLGQCLAIWPGMSRSGSTIVSALALGIKRKPAAEFSFLIAVPVMFAAIGYDLLKSWKFLELADFGYFSLGFAVSFLVAWGSVKWFLKALVKIGLIPFAFYRIILGCFLLWLYLV